MTIIFYSHRSNLALRPLILVQTRFFLIWSLFSLVPVLYGSNTHYSINSEPRVSLESKLRTSKVSGSFILSIAGADPAQNLTGSNGNPKNFDRRKVARKIFRPARGVRGMLLRKILKIQLLIWAKIAFPALYYALSSQIFDNF